MHSSYTIFTHFHYARPAVITLQRTKTRFAFFAGKTRQTVAGEGADTVDADAAIGARTRHAIVEVL